VNASVTVIFATPLLVATPEEVTIIFFVKVEAADDVDDPLKVKSTIGIIEATPEDVEVPPPVNAVFLTKVADPTADATPEAVTT